MIPSYTRRHLSMHMCGSIYFLPFEVSLSPEEVMEKTIELFSKKKWYERDMYHDCAKKEAVSHERNGIQIKCLYEGYDEYYPFICILEVFRLNDEKQIHPGAYMISIRMEHVYQGLLDELLEMNVVPKMVSAFSLKPYSYLE